MKFYWKNVWAAVVLLLTSNILFAQLSGSGSVSDPYLIQSEADLVYLSANGIPANWRNYQLTTNLDMTGQSFYGIGGVGGANGVGVFMGTFDGDGHVIRNLTITQPIDDNFDVGFIPRLQNGAVIRNLGLINITIDASACENVGGIAGRMAGATGIIENCFVDGGSISTSKKSGGIVGIAYEGTIRNCYQNVTVISNSGGWPPMGGLTSQMDVWAANAVTIENVMVYGDITATGNMTPVQAVFGQVLNGSAPTISGAYYSETCTFDDANATEIAVADQGNTASYAGFDFGSVWKIQNGQAVLQFTPYVAPPVADAGADQQAFEGQVAGLSGAGSSMGTLGTALVYNWSTSADYPSLSFTYPDSPSMENAEFTVPAFANDTILMILLQVNDGNADSDVDTVLVTVRTAAGNTAPTANAGSDQSVKYGSTVTLTGSGADADGDALAYAWILPDAITVADTTAQNISFTVPFDYTSDTTLEIILNTVDSPLGGISENDTVLVTVIANAKPLATAVASVDTASSGVTVQLTASAASDPNGDALYYSWIAPAVIEINDTASASTSFRAPVVTDTTDFYIALLINDGTLVSDTSKVMVVVVPPSSDNSAPTDITLSAEVIAENEAEGTLVATLSASDLDLTDVHTFSLVAGNSSNDAGNTQFIISNDSLFAVASFDFETQESYKIFLQADDGRGGVYTEAFVIAVEDVNDRPHNLWLTSMEFSEAVPAETAIATIYPSDVDPVEPFRYVFVDGWLDHVEDDQDLFRIDEDQLIITVQADYETKAEYNVFIRVFDALGRAFTKHFTLAVSDANEVPTALELSSTLINENAAIGAVVGIFSTSDENESDVHTYSLVAGDGTNDADNASFQIDGDELQLNTALDFNVQTSYNILAQTDDDNGGFLTEAFVITVTDENQVPSQITLMPASISELAEAGTLVGILSTADDDLADTHSYGLVAGNGTNDADNDNFSISNDSLFISTSSDFETQSAYTILIQTNDGNGGLYEQSLSIAVEDANEVPTGITLSVTEVSEAAIVGSVVATLATIDENSGDSYTYSLVAGNGTNDADNASFSISANELLLNANLDYENQTECSILVQTDDGNGGVFVSSLTIAVTNANDLAPVVDAQSFTIDENTANATLVGNVLAVDPDEFGETLSYSIVSGNTDDAFAIDAERGAITVSNVAALDFETTPEFTLEVEVSDGVNIGSGMVTVTLNDVEEPTALDAFTSVSFQVYPNPVSDVLKLTMDQSIVNKVQWELLETSGRIITQGTISAEQVSSELNISELASGSYLLKIIADGTSTSQMILKQ